MTSTCRHVVVAAMFSILAIRASSDEPPPPLPPPPANAPKPPKRIRETLAFIPTDVLRRVSGVVELKLRIGTDGKVLQVDVLRGPKEIAEPLAAAARNWLYEPTRVEGRPVEVTTTTVIHIMPPPL
ncbi:MAG TPA: energy transducer TonB [Bryobacteraceae bacterium]|jgi:protein TonB|nr:energy transducer TonB [Bryobacteraceae bacterium]